MRCRLGVTMLRCGRCGLRVRDKGKGECGFCSTTSSIAKSLKARERSRIKYREHSSEIKSIREHNEWVLKNASPDEVLNIVGEMASLERPLRDFTRKEKAKMLSKVMKTYKVSIVEYVVASNPVSAREKAMKLFGFPQSVLDKIETLDIEVRRIDDDEEDRKEETSQEL